MKDFHRILGLGGVDGAQSPFVSVVARSYNHHHHPRRFSTSTSTTESASKGEGEEEGGTEPAAAGSSDSNSSTEGDAEGGEDKEEVVKLQSEIEALKKDLDKKDADLKEANSKVVYTLAEMENVRAIARRDADTGKKFAVQSFAKALLEVGDYLAMAVSSVSEDAKKDPAVKTLVEGVEMTESAMLKVFKKEGLERYGKVGDKFDPNLHDAMFTVDDPDAEPGTIAQVIKTGYTLHDRVIRAAQVGTVPEKPS